MVYCNRKSFKIVDVRVALSINFWTLLMDSWFMDSWFMEVDECVIEFF